jgi:hypothetical protein
MPKEKTVKEKKEKVLTRAQAEKALTAGANPENFVKHPNYHVRAKAWRKSGSPLPDNAEERSKFLASIHVKEPQAL